MTENMTSINYDAPIIKPEIPSQGAKTNQAKIFFFASLVVCAIVVLVVLITNVYNTKDATGLSVEEKREIYNFINSREEVAISPEVEQAIAEDFKNAPKVEASEEQKTLVSQYLK